MADLVNDGFAVLTDGVRTAPLAAPPGGPTTNDIYLDDGTNTASGQRGWRQWTGAAWVDLGAVGGGTAIGQTIIVHKGGNDANSGRTFDLAKLTIGSAITAAAALTPSASNRIAIIVYPGRYSEQVTLSSDYVSLIGAGGRDDVEIYWGVNSARVLSIEASYLEVRNISATGHTMNVYAGRVTSGQQDVRLVNCHFTSNGSGRQFRFETSNEVQAVGCKFDHPLADRQCIRSQGGNVRLWDCEFTAEVSLEGGTFIAYNCIGEANLASAAVVDCANAMTEFKLIGCDITNINSTGRAVDTTSNASIVGGYLCGGTNGADIRGGGSPNPISVNGVRMEHGMDATVRLNSGVYRVAPAGSYDFHATLQGAITAGSGYSSKIFLERDVSISSQITTSAVDLVIDGGSDHHSISCSTTNCFSIGENAELTLKNLTISDGDIDIPNNGAKVQIINCLIERTVKVSGGDSDTELLILDTDIVSGDTNEEALLVSDADPTVKIIRSYLAGNGNEVAVRNSGDNPNLYCQWSSFLHGASAPSTSAFSNPTGSTNIHVHHCCLNAALPGNYSNQIATPYNVVDLSVQDFPPAHSW
jgi:hypothetical protein